MEKRILALICLIVCLSLFLLPCTTSAVSTVDAVEPIAVSQKGSIAATYAHDGVGFPDVSVSLYKIAEVSSDFQYTLTGEFQPTGLQLNGISSTGEWDTIRTTLDAYIAAHHPKVTAFRTTDADGQVSFSGLTPGMYWISSVQCDENGFRYYFASVLTSLPDLQEDGTWNYDVTIRPKPDIQNPTGKDLEYKVLKLWKDSGNANNRPTSVEIAILRNEKVVRTVTLSEENNWCYRWYAEDDGSVWQVAENNVPKGYVSTVNGRGTTTFTVVNSIPDSSGSSNAPKTGDTFNQGLYIILAALSGALLLLLSATEKRKPQ